jgi:amidase
VDGDAGAKERQPVGPRLFTSAMPTVAHAVRQCPWDLRITPGGSSGGAGAAAAIASQLMAVQGPLARSVADLRLAFTAMAVPDPRDPRGVPIGVGPRPARPIRVALVPRPGGVDVHPAVADAVSQAGRARSAAGYDVEETEPPGFMEAAHLWQSLAMPDTIARLEPLVAASGDAAIKLSLGLWREVFPVRDPNVCLEALAQRWRLAKLWQEFFDRVPILVAPISRALPFEVGTDVRDRETPRG